MNKSEIRKKILGGWVGKSIGGTLGAPYEGCNGPLALTFYDPVPTTMLPNDDLDLQILIAWALRKEEKPVIDRNFFATVWKKHVRFCFDEYAVALKNFDRGIYPPASGCYDNYFIEGLGAAIRSELWAALAPGNPALAAAYAYEDACLDHDADGIYAEQFLAALESAAFVTDNIDALLDAGVSVIPESSRMARMTADIRERCQSGETAEMLREYIIREWGSDNFTNCVMNLAFCIMALILGKGDFSQSICLAANCGRDTDCTAATVGAILGIAKPDAIPEKWIAPIGHDCVVSDPIIGITPPATLDELADWVLEISARLPEFTPGSQLPYTTKPITAECYTVTPWFMHDDRRFMKDLTIARDVVVREFPGQKASIMASELPPDSMYMMKFHFNLAQSRKVMIMFNSRENTRVWLDGEYAFGREGGRMAPSFHRCPVNQMMELFLEAGRHELLCGIAPLSGEESMEWVMGVADAQTRLFLSPEEFYWE